MKDVISIDRCNACGKHHGEPNPCWQWMDAKDVAKVARRILKDVFPAAKFSVRISRYSMGSSVDVTWEDGPTTRRVESEILFLQTKTFDGMTDSEGQTPEPFELNGVCYRTSCWLHCHRRYSEAFLRRVDIEMEKRYHEVGQIERQQYLYRHADNRTYPETPDFSAGFESLQVRTG